MEHNVFKQVVEGAETWGVTIVDADGNIEYMNPRSYEVLGLDPKKIGHINDTMPPSQVPAARQEIMYVLKTQTTKRHLKDMGFGTCYVEMRPLTKNTVVYMVISLEDIVNVAPAAETKRGT